MLRFLLDTDVISEGARPHGSELLLARIEKHREECALAAPTWCELLYGLERLPAGRRREIVSAYLMELAARSLVILPYETGAAAWHARERARLDGAGTRPPFVDGQIAAVAAVNGLAVVTRNVRDFRLFRGVKVHDWTKG